MLRRRCLVSCLGPVSSSAVLAPLSPCRALCTATKTLLLRGDKFTMSKRRRMMQQTHYCKPGPSIPIAILIMLYACFNIVVTMLGKNDDSIYR